jgi:hypothetical protein
MCYSKRTNLKIGTVRAQDRRETVHVFKNIKLFIQSSQLNALCPGKSITHEFYA